MHLLLHIGPPKTGSTAIQAALSDSTADLNAKGVFFDGGMPLRALSARYTSEAVLAKTPVSRRLGGIAGVRAWSERAWQELASGLEASDADLCILSSEHFAYSIDFDGLAGRLSDLFDGITVLAFVRDPVSQYLSGLQQSIRGGARFMDLPMPCDFTYRVRNLLERYSDLVGRENVIVRNFAGGNVVTEFSGQLKRLGKQVDLPELIRNPSAPGAVLAMLLFVNECRRQDFEPERRRKFVNRLVSSREVMGLPSLRLDQPWVAAQIHANAGADCAWVNENFLQGQASLPVVSPEGGAFPPRDAQRAAVRDTILSYLRPETVGLLGRAGIGLGVSSPA